MDERLWLAVGDKLTTVQLRVVHEFARDAVEAGWASYSNFTRVFYLLSA